MADYYSILKKTIDGLPNNTPEVRQAVFRKARTAIETQLRGMSPTPSEQAIATQLKLLEESILVVDAEYAPAAPVTPPPVATAPVTPPPAPSAPVASAPMTEPVAPVATPEPQPAAPQQATPTHPAAPEVPVAPVAQPETVAAVEAPPTVDAIPGPEVVSAPETTSLAGSGPDLSQPEKKSGGFGKVLTTLVVLGLLGGGGYAIWTNKEAFQPLLASLTSSDQAAEEKEAAKPLSEDEKALEEDTSAQVEKEAVKLGQNGEDTEVKEPEVVRIIEPEPETKPLEEILPNEDEASSAEDVVVVEPVEEVVEPTEPEQPAAEEDTQTVEEAQPEETQPEQTQTLPIGEVAYLYEEGSAGAGASRINAAVTWTTKRESIADGLAPESVIVGTMEVPERNLSVDIEIKRNVDDAVSASHLIEMRFEIPEGFDGGGIDNIARFVMKATEEARGEPLIAVPVKVSDGFFLIALDNLQQAVSANTQLMTESAWIDIPVSYATGKRALITLEKGGTGDQVFRDAFRDWENR